MEINKIGFFVMLITIVLLATCSMAGGFYFANLGINLVRNEAPPLTISRTQSNSLKRLIKGN